MTTTRWRAEQNGANYLITNGHRYLLAAHGNDKGNPHQFGPVDTAARQWALSRLDGQDVEVSSVDKDGYVWIITAVPGVRHVLNDYMMCVGRVDETEAGWDAFAANGTLLRHWHGWNSGGYPDRADAVRAVVKFHNLTAQSRATALATGSASAVTEEGPWRVKWARATDSTKLVVTAKEAQR